eukprot:1192302-Prorocentrum_minimum.AAC.3
MDGIEYTAINCRASPEQSRQSFARCAKSSCSWFTFLCVVYLPLGTPPAAHHLMRSLTHTCQVALS